MNEENNRSEEQIQEAADALREDMERTRREQGKIFCKGIALGVLASYAVVLLAFLVGINAGVIRRSTGTSSQTDSVLTTEVASKIRTLEEMIDQLYYEDVDDADLAEGLYKGLLEGVGDTYTAYYTPEEYKNLLFSATSTLNGIGAVLQQDPDTMRVTVIRVYEGTPAEQAGIQAGDVIMRVENIVATSMEVSELVAHIRGDAGTEVHLTIYREGESDYLEFDVTRDVVDVPTVSGRMLDDGIGYIRIGEFGSKTATEFSEQVSQLEKEGMTSMIVDLRDNPGGMVDSVTEILDQILPEGVTVWTEDKQGRKKEFTSDSSCMDYPMAVLINGSSASSAEIFAGAIRDYEYGTLIGTKTYGKGIVQSIRKLSDGSAIKLTTAKYFTPSGENIHGEGIEPDIELEYEYLDPDATEYNIMDDNQVRKAIEVLTQKK